MLFLTIRQLVEQCCGTPDGMGVTPAGVPHKYVPVKKRSKLDKMAAKRGLRESLEEDEDLATTEYYGDFNVSYSPLADKWVMRKGLDFVSQFDDRKQAVAEAKKESGQQEQNDIPGPKMNPVDYTTPLPNAAATVGGAGAPGAMSGMPASPPPSSPMPSGGAPVSPTPPAPPMGASPPASAGPGASAGPITPTGPMGGPAGPGGTVANVSGM